ncbi:MAG: DUF2339 domain-containing protein, partial [Synergistaceae bacterium]|nr:DUF2339 domain-containing protein [Synergistaceae bacterium]
MLVSIGVVILPIVIIIMISGLHSRLAAIEESISALKNLVLSPESIARQRDGAESRMTDEKIPPIGETGRDVGVVPGIQSVESISLRTAAEEAIAGSGHGLIEGSGVEAVSQIEDALEPVIADAVFSDSGGGREDEPASVVTEALAGESPPSWMRTQARSLVTWLLAEGNIWVTGGVMLFLAGFGLLFSYVERRYRIPTELRLIAASAIGIAMTAFGWRMRSRRRTYALILQGGGIGVLYIVLLAGAKLGGVIPAPGAVLGMMILSAFTVLLAIFQEFEPLALSALLGGYAAPILVSSGSSNFVAMFSIHALLNFEVLMISVFRDWRKVRWIGLVASCAVGAAWGALRWQDSFLASVEPFLILFFVNYSAIALMPLLSARIGRFSKKIAPHAYDRIDMPMISALPFILIFLQMAAASHTKYGVAVTCIALGAWHLLMGYRVMRSPLARSAGYSHSL